MHSTVLKIINDVIDEHEGGFQNLASDPGNYYKGKLYGTKWGLSAAFLGSHGYKFELENLQYLPKSRAADIYEKHFWSSWLTKLLEYRFTEETVKALYSIGINTGVKRSEHIFQIAINVRLNSNPIIVDGIIGPNTLAAAKSLASGPAYNRVAVEAVIAGYYYGLSVANKKNEQFLNSWWRRLVPGRWRK